MIPHDAVLALHPETWAAMRAVLDLEAAGARFTPEQRAMRAGLAARPGAGGARSTGTIAVLGLYGLLTHRSSLFNLLFGGTSADALRAAIQQAAADPAITAILLDTDSPGGEVSGVEELAAAVAEAARVKPVTAIANAWAGSAAFWAIAPARELVVTPSGQVGSIGTFTVHQDFSKMQERQGVATTLIFAGSRKVDGNPFEPLSDRARADLQAMADRYYTMFVNRVAAGRRVSAERVRTGFGEGRMVMAAEAVRLGMVDQIATLDETLARLAGVPGRAGRFAARSPGAADVDFRKRRLRAAAAGQPVPLGGAPGGPRAHARPDHPVAVPPPHGAPAGRATAARLPQGLGDGLPDGRRPGPAPARPPADGRPQPGGRRRPGAGRDDHDRPQDAERVRPLPHRQPRRPPSGEPAAGRGGRARFRARSSRG